jgi:Flp pilus assembly pilin Flp
MVEYSLLVSLIALTLIASLQQLATALVTFFSNVSTSLA